MRYWIDAIEIFVNYRHDTTNLRMTLTGVLWYTKILLFRVLMNLLMLLHPLSAFIYKTKAKICFWYKQWEMSIHANVSPLICGVLQNAQLSYKSIFLSLNLLLLNISVTNSCNTINLQELIYKLPKQGTLPQKLFTIFKYISCLCNIH